MIDFLKKLIMKKQEYCKSRKRSIKSFRWRLQMAIGVSSNIDDKKILEAELFSIDGKKDII